MAAELELRGVLFALWRDDSAVGALVADRIYDRVPLAPVFPYVTFGETQTLDRDAICYPRFEINQTIHVWSREPGQVEAMRIADALRVALRNAALPQTLTTPNFHVASAWHASTRFLTDPDGLTAHGILTFAVVLDPK